MAINMKDLNKLAKFARKNGLTSLKVGVDGIELQFHAAFLQQATVEDAAAQDEKMPAQYTDEQILNWSSTTYVEAN